MSERKDSRVEKLVEELLHGDQFNVANNYRLLVDPEEERKSASPLFPLEVFQLADQEIYRMLSLHVSDVQNFGERLSGVGTGGPGTAPPSSLDDSSWSVESASLSGSRSVLVSGQELRSRQRRLCKELRKGNLSRFERMALGVLQGTINAGDWGDLEIDDHLVLARNATRLARKAAWEYPRSTLAAWAHARTARFWGILVGKTRWNARLRRVRDESVRNLLECLIGDSETGALSSHRAGKVPGLYSSMADVVIGLLVLGQNEQKQIQAGLHRVRETLLGWYSRLGEDRLLDRMGLCTLLSVASEGVVARAFAWETVQIAALFISRRDVSTEMIRSFADSDSGTPHGRGVRSYLGQVQGRLARSPCTAKYRIPTTHTAIRSIFKKVGWLSRRFGNLLLDTQELGAWAATDAFSCNPEDMELLRSGNLDKTRKAVESACNPESKIRRLLVRSVLEEEHGRIDDAFRALAEAREVLSKNGLRNSTMGLDFAWRVATLDGVLERSRRRYDRAVLRFREAGRCAAGAYLLPRSAQSLLGLVKLYETAGLHGSADGTRSVLRIVSGLGLLLGLPEVVRFQAELFPPQVSPIDPLELELRRMWRQLHRSSVPGSTSMRGTKNGISPGPDRKTANRAFIEWVRAALSRDPDLGYRILADAAKVLIKTLEETEDVGLAPELLEDILICLRGFPRQSQENIRSFKRLRDMQSRATRRKVPLPEPDQLEAHLRLHLQSIEAPTPLRCAVLILSLVWAALDGLRRGRGSPPAGLRDLTRELFERIDELCPPHNDGSPWWRHSRLELAILEGRSRLEGIENPVLAMGIRREQYLRRAEIVNGFGHRSGLVIHEADLLEKALASALWDPARVELSMLADDLERAKALTILSNAGGELTAPSEVRETDVPFLVTDGGLQPEDFLEEPPEGGRDSADVRIAPLGQALPKWVILEYFLAPNMVNGPSWDALCVGSRVTTDSSGTIGLDPIRLFVLGDPRSVMSNRLLTANIRTLVCKMRSLWQLETEAREKVTRQNKLSGELKTLATLATQIGSAVFPSELSEWLAQEKPDHVFLCPHRDLFSVPLHALPMSKKDGLWIHEPFTTSYLPMGSHLLPLLGNAGGDVPLWSKMPLFFDQGLCVKESNGGNIESKFVATGVFEAQKKFAVGDIFETIRRSRCGTFFCHGLLGSHGGGSWRSRLLLPDGARLSVREVNRCDAELAGCEIVLLACHSGSRQSTPGIGNVGLTDAFMRKGVHSVVATFFEVPVQIAARFLCEYAGHRAGGVSGGMAFRKALQSGSAPLVEPPPWGSAQEWLGWLDWAPFALFGLP